MLKFDRAYQLGSKCHRLCNFASSWAQTNRRKEALGISVELFWIHEDGIFNSRPVPYVNLKVLNFNHGKLTGTPFLWLGVCEELVAQRLHTLAVFLGECEGERDELSNDWGMKEEWGSNISWLSLVARRFAPERENSPQHHREERGNVRHKP